MKLKKQRDIWGQSCSRSHNPFVSNQKLGSRGSDQRHRQLSPGEPDSLNKHRWSFACRCQLGLILETKNPAGSGGKESACNAGDPNSIPRIQQWCKTWSLQEIVFISFWRCWVFVAARAFLSLLRVGVTLQLRCMGFSWWWLLLLQSTGSGAQAQWLQRSGLVAPWHVESSRIRDGTCVSCIGRWTLPLSHQESPVYNFILN